MPSSRWAKDDPAQVLACGIDTLYWSGACGIAAEHFGRLCAARDRASKGIEVVELNGHALVVEPHGARRYPVLLTCREFSVQLTDSAHLPTAMVQLRSEFLHDKGGPRAAFEASASVVQALCGRPVHMAKASRLDVYADVGGWVLTDTERRGVVTHAKLHPVLRAGTDEYETIQIGKQPGMLVRLYRKDVEVSARPGFADHFWGGYTGPVVRVEAEAGSKKLRQVGIVSVDDALCCYGNLWRYATEDFSELRVPGEGDREGWELDGRWRMLRTLAFGQFPRCEMAAMVKAEREQDRIGRGLLGFLASWAAGEGVFDADEAWRRLGARYPGFVSVPDRTFAGEVVRNHVRKPRVVRRRVVG